MLPFVSVILPVCNQRYMLPRLLEQLLAQNYPPDRYEILVVDGRSTDGTPDLVRRRFLNRRVRIRVLDNPAATSSAGRNIGIRAASGDIFLFIDGHCSLPSRNLIEDSVAILQRTGAGCLSRPQPLLAPSATDTGEIIARVHDSWLGRASRACHPGAAGFVDPVLSGSTYRRETFERLGLFDESFDAGEDVEFNTRLRKAGLTAYTDPRLAVYYQPQPRVGSLFRHRLREGRSRVRLLRRHAGALSLAALSPLLLLLCLPLAVLAWIFLPAAAAAVLTLPLVLFAAAALVASTQLGFQHGFATAWSAPWILSAIYLGLGSGIFLELLAPSRVRRSQPVEILRPREEPEVVARGRAA